MGTAVSREWKTPGKRDKLGARKLRGNKGREVRKEECMGGTRR